MTRFEWDPEKALANIIEHGVSFEEAQTVFGDNLAQTIPDQSSSWYEARYGITGESSSGRLLVVVYTEQGDTIRIIGARRPTLHERHDYEESQA